MKKYKYMSRGVPVFYAYGPEDFELLADYSADGWKFHSLVTCQKWRTYIFETEVSDPDEEETKKLNLELLCRLASEQKKPGGISNADIERANELLSEAQKKEGIPSNRGGKELGEIIETGKPRAFIRKIFLSALGEGRFECYSDYDDALISGSYATQEEAETHIKTSGYVFTGVVIR